MRRRIRTLGSAAAVILASCFGDSTGPGRGRPAHFGFVPSFSSTGVTGVAFDHVRIRLTVPAGGAVALDTVVSFPSSDSILTLSLSVPIAGTSQDFDLTLALSDAAGDTVFRGGPVPITAAVGVLAPPVTVPLRYTGVGANAAFVIFTAPVPTTVFFGDSVTFTALALDSTEQPILGTPIVWAIDARDTSLARVPVDTIGRVVAKSVRGKARVIARTLTNQADTTILAVQPKPAALAVTAGNGQSGPAGGLLAQPVTVRVKGSDSLGVAGVTVNFAVATGGGIPSAGTATTDSLGYASVGWTLGVTAGAQSMTATVAGLTPVTITATATPTTPAIHLIFPGNLIGVSSTLALGIKLSQPAPAGGAAVTVTSDSTAYVTVASPGTVSFAAGDTLKTINITGVAVGVSLLHATATGYTADSIFIGVSPNVIVLGQNVAVAVGQTANVPIQLVPAAPTGGLTVTLVSTDTAIVKVTTPTVNIAAGQTSGSATVQGIASGYAAVEATAPNYATGAALVTVGVAGQAATLTKVAGDGQSAPAGTAVPVAPQVKVTDVLGAAVANATVTFTVTAGGGSVTGATVQSDVNGLAAVGSWTLGATAGTNALTATVTGVVPETFTATGTSSGIVATTVTPTLDTITAINGTSTLVAQAKNAAGGNVTGSFTWTSRAPSIASVDATGKVTGLANGSTYVVATESGGTRDSALIVVQQKLASITVTPASRNLYLGTNYTYTATAVDGLGTPLPTNPTFTWTTSAPAVATVDTAGHVAAIGLGTAQIKATSGSVTGVGNLSVITAITRIAVAVDSSGSTKTDTATLSALTATRRYHAYAYDTLNVLMTSVTAFTWASTNPSVAGIPNQTSDTATATSAANGVTAVKATAQGFTSTPGALLTVAQKLTSIQLSPATATIGVGGQVALTARGLDSLGHYISGGSFTYVSKDTLIAKVGATTGIVTGVAVGSDTVVADSAALVSNPAIITVSNSVPAAISFGRDTVSVGRGSSASIPILLSTPVPAGGPSLIVKLGVSPAAYAHWSTLTVTIPAGQNTTNATLVGDSAGTTTVSATDSSGLGYAAGSATAKVTANMALASSSYALNATDVATTQVLLSDPSPAGGTYVTFNYGTSGIATVSPNPAFIPAGQLAADIQISGLAAGTTTITPTAIGVNGLASNVTVYAPVLNLNSTLTLLGLGQYDPNRYVYLPTYTNVALPVTLTSADTTKATVTPVVTVPTGYRYAYFTVSAAGLGATRVTPSATGWTAGSSDSVIVTTPHVGVSGGGTYYTTSGTQYVYLYAEDSTFNSHYRTNSLLVSLRSSDTTVMKVIDSVVTIGAGGTYTTGRVTPGGLGGSAYIIASASGHTPDSVQYTILGPPLSLNWTSQLIGVGQQDINVRAVTVPNNVTAPLVVHLANSDSTKAAAPDSVIIPAGYNYVYFTIQGYALGTDTIRATAAGYQSDSAVYVVGPPALALNTTSYTFNAYNAGANFTVYSTDTIRYQHSRIAPDTVSITVRDTTIATVDSSTVTIPAGKYYNGNWHVTPRNVGSTYVVVSATGQRALDSLLVTVKTPLIQINFGSVTLGRRQHLNSSGNGFYVYIPDARLVNVPATITQRNSKVDSVSTLAPVIDSATTYTYLEAYGMGNGTDTLTVSASGYASGNPAYVTVTTPRFTGAGLPSSTTTTNQSAIAVYVYAADSLGNIHYTMDTVTVHAVSSDTTVIKPDSAYYHIVKNGSSVSTSVHVFGPGSAYMVFSDSANSGYLPDTTNTMTVTGPSLSFSPSAVTLGMRQTTGPSGVLVYTQNIPTSPVVVHLKSTDTLVVTVPDSVIIPTTSTYVYFPVNAMDTLGTIQVQATATGFGSGTMSVQVTRPKFYINTAPQLNTTSPRSKIWVYAQDANGVTHYTTDSVIVHLASSATSVATVDSAVVTIPKGQNYNANATWGPASLTTPGTAQLTATDTTPALYAYTQDTFDVAVVTPKLVFSWSTQPLALGQYNRNEYVYSPDNATSPITVSLAHSGHIGILVGGVPVTSVTIPAGTSITYFNVVGDSTGLDTLVATASTPPFNPDTAYTGVSQGHVDPLGSWPTTLSISGTDSALVYLYARDSTQTTHYVQDSTTFTLATTGSIQFWSGGANSVQITSIVIPKDQSYVTLYVKGVSQGSGSATISATNYVTYTTPTITVSP